VDIFEQLINLLIQREKEEEEEKKREWEKLEIQKMGQCW
jgi:hypothetical protein